MKRSTGMNIICGLLLIASTLLFFACGREQTMASKSAAAYREAQAKGTAVTGGHEHGGHAAAATTVGTEAMDHSAHGTTSDPHAGHDESAAGDAHAGHGAAPGRAMDHAAHGTMSAADYAAMGHGTTGDAHAGHTTARERAAGAMDHARHGSTSAVAGQEAHATTTGTATHDQHAAGAPPVVSSAPTANAEIARTQPAATLRPDDFDAPAASAVEEARKATAGGGHQGHGTSGTTPSTTGADPHAGHGSASGASQQTVYTCPMHPEVTSATPGTCPKCGMTLVKKEK